MNVFLDILVVLIAAKVAVEVAERVGLPAVVAEILAGVVIGPSALHLVGGDEVLRVLGEFGVILLLLEVGLQMDLTELGAVGKASFLVASVGVIAPFALGWGGATLMGESANSALFIGAALTATSVGITARVLGDLRALAMVEARTVLGAAVVDDVMGLVILTVVVRIATEGSVSALSVLGIVVVAIAFLAFTGIAGVRLAPPFFRLVHRVSRSPGTMISLALAFTLAFAELANVAKLAPIVGAFVAGLALARSDQSERIRRELTPVGHLFIPVFFLQIGIDANIEAFARPAVLGIAGVLLAAAIVGKMVSPLGAVGSPGDKLLIGLGMLPRGEVGLIFAGIGLREAILSEDLYAALLLVVLVTTLISPTLLRWRLQRVRDSCRRLASPAAPRPQGGWLKVESGQIRLAASPPEFQALHVTLQAASLAAAARPGEDLLEWLSSVGEAPLRWDSDATSLLFQVLSEGNVRSWRFLEASGMLERALPELSDTVQRRRADPFELDPNNILRWSLVDRVRDLANNPDMLALAHPEWLLLAALILETAGDDAPVTMARRLVKRLDLGAAAEQEVALLVGESGLLRAAAGRVGGLREEKVLPIAAHLEQPERGRALYLLSLALGDLDADDQARLTQLHSMVQSALARTELTGRPARNLVERRRAEAIRLVGDGAAAERVRSAPLGYLLTQESAAIARQVPLLDPLPPSGRARVTVHAGREGSWRLILASRDRTGLLAAVTDVLAELDFEVTDAAIATWSDGAALEAFGVKGERAPDAAAIEHDVAQAMGRPQIAEPVADAEVTFDHDASPWYSICEVRAPDRPGLLHSLAVAMATAGVDVHTATVATLDGMALDRFEVTDRRAAKLGVDGEAAIRVALAAGVGTGRRGSRRGGSRDPGGAVTKSKHSGDRQETVVP